jgi:hypothetical protein
MDAMLTPEGFLGARMLLPTFLFTLGVATQFVADKMQGLTNDS